MVNDVGKLTRSIRRSVAQERAKSSLRNLTIDRKKGLLAELDRNGRAEYSDTLGNRFQIKRKPA